MEIFVKIRRRERSTPSLFIRYVSLPMPLIMGGQVQDMNLEIIGQNRFWLKNQLQALGIYRFQEVYICTVNHRGQMFILKL